MPCIRHSENAVESEESRQIMHRNNRLQPIVVKWYLCEVVLPLALANGVNVAQKQNGFSHIIQMIVFNIWD